MYSNTEKNRGRVFYKCMYFSVSLISADSVGAVVEKEVECPPVAPSGPIVNMSLADERLDRIPGQLRWLEKLMFVCILLVVCAICMK